MRKPNKKGFTIVELVIVIAVVAILAAVLIPTFVNVVNKANVSNDTALVKNINLTLAAEEITDGKPATMHDALVMAERGGFDVSKLTPRSSGNIVWDSETNRFALVDKNGNKVFSENDKNVPKNASVWKIVDSKESAESEGAYSVYLKNGLNIDTLSVTTGLDVGNCTVGVVNYTGSETQAAVIRTNGGEFSSTGAVNHYGNAKKITTNGTYNEYGSAKQIFVTGGTLTTQSSSVVTSIVSTPAADKTVTIDVSKKVAEVVVTSEYASRTTVIGTTAVDKSKTVVNALEEAKTYPVNATRVPDGFVVDKNNKTITIKDATALMYYGYVLDTTEAEKADLSSGTKELDSIWHNNLSYKNVAVSLDSDIDLDGAILTAGMNMHGAKTFNGNGHTIKNVTVKDSTSYTIGGNGKKWNNVGLFKTLNHAAVSNLTLENIKIETSVEGEINYVTAGILAGSTSGNVSGIIINNSSVSGGYYTGGIVGYAYGSINDCKLNNCSVSGQYKVGGIVGYICAEFVYNVKPSTPALRTVNGNVLSEVVVAAENVLSGKTAVVGKIIGNFNGDYDTTDKIKTKGECKNNTFTGTCSGKFVESILTENIDVAEENNK